MPNYIYILASSVIAFFVTIMIIPTVIKISYQLKLFSDPNGRSVTDKRIPTLGGIAIFAGFILGITVTREGYMIAGLSFLIAGVLIMFFVGLGDDIVHLSAAKKLLAQLIVAAILIFLGDFRLTNLHGFAGINEIPMVASYLLTAFVMIVIINSFNLIDGIDGLASGLSIFYALIFGGWFYLVFLYKYSVLAFSLVGALSGFFLFNVYGKKNKIFMGDNGSLMLGTIMSVLAIQFNEYNLDQTYHFSVNAAPAISFGILIYPLLDTLKVIAIRLYLKKSPFHADKNHTHHRLLALGLSHRQASFVIIAVNAAFTLCVFQFRNIGIIGLMTINLIGGSILLLVPSYLLSRKNLIPSNDPYQTILLFRRKHM